MKRIFSLVITAAIILTALSCSAISASADTIRGDINGDNNITLRDATLVQKILAKSLDANAYQKVSADFDKNSTVELADALLIQKYVCMDKTTVDEIVPNRSQRIAFYTALNQDRVSAGLTAIDYNDAMMEAGTIRAREYIERGDNYRADGKSQFTTIFAECNLDASNGSPLEKTAHDVVNGTRFYNICKNDSTPVYNYMMTSSCTIVCLGSIPDSSSSTMATWVIDVA